MSYFSKLQIGTDLVLGYDTNIFLSEIDLSPTSPNDIAVPVPQANTNVFVSNYQRGRVVNITGTIIGFNGRDVIEKIDKLQGNLYQNQGVETDYIYTNREGMSRGFKGRMSSPSFKENGSEYQRDFQFSVICSSPFLYDLQDYTVTQSLIKGGMIITPEGYLIIPTIGPTYPTTFIPEGFVILDDNSVNLTINYSGSAPTYPIYTFTGELQNLKITNTGKNLGSFMLGNRENGFYIGDNQKIVVNSDPLERTVWQVDSLGNQTQNRNGLNVTNFDGLALLPGINNLFIQTIGNITENSLINLVYKAFYQGF